MKGDMMAIGLEEKDAMAWLNWRREMNYSVSTPRKEKKKTQGREISAVDFLGAHGYHRYRLFYKLEGGNVLSTKDHLKFFVLFMHTPTPIPAKCGTSTKNGQSVLYRVINSIHFQVFPSYTVSESLSFSPFSSSLASCFDSMDGLVSPHHFWRPPFMMVRPMPVQPFTSLSIDRSCLVIS